ncbi:uncharacterized protein Z518_03139 [Rhinocladiella mackenziei CBS 650.93]|uniref:DUF7053 domain-containing protein n=1 Tax=Rhinocladiella mackenziei CBS 650.93 TaxID=1442369 RepID=A0A0D2HDC3_9EURO|nr:uncharacterized protein Z518_03139 [Rhinocladiella mackenziei CBS 650.93]KIX08483.1 hypothetical protein Z518_03139 [Rhinocladiella mackenziei CBS 650.93]
MSLLQTTFKSGWITDLVLPPVPEGKTPSDVLYTGYRIALEMCSDANLMARLNPLVQSVNTIGPSHAKAVDYQSLAADFGVDLSAQYATGRFTQYEIMDKLPLLFGYSTELRYYSAIRPTKDGMEALTNPGSGVTIYGRFTVQIAQATGPEGGAGMGGSYATNITGAEGSGANVDVENNIGGATGTERGVGVIHFLETNELKCNVFLSWYIKASTDKSHRTAHANFKERWIARMKELGYPPA